MARESRKDKERKYAKLKSRKEALMIHPLVRASLAWGNLAAFEKSQIAQKWNKYYEECAKSKSAQLYGEMTKAIQLKDPDARTTAINFLLKELQTISDAGDYLQKPSDFSPEDLENGTEVKEYQKVLQALRDIDGEGYVSEIDDIFGGVSNPYRD